MRRELTFEQRRQLKIKEIKRAAKKTQLGKQDFVDHHYNGLVITKPEVEQIYDDSRK
jgi:hypothetical protein